LSTIESKSKAGRDARYSCELKASHNKTFLAGRIQFDACRVFWIEEDPAISEYRFVGADARRVTYRPSGLFVTSLDDDSKASIKERLPGVIILGEIVAWFQDPKRCAGHD